LLIADVRLLIEEGLRDAIRAIWQSLTINQQGSDFMPFIQEGGDLVLDGFDLVEAEAGVRDDENLAGLDMLVHQGAAVDVLLGLDLLEEALSLSMSARMYRAFA